MNKSQILYTGRGKVDAPSTRQKPLGTILMDARKEKGWSRAYLATATGINQNSIAKYEQAGIDDDDGRFPASPKLAVLCFALDVDPLTALLGCVPKDDYGMYEGISSHGYAHHPQMKWIANQMSIALQESMLLKNFCELLVENLDTSKMTSDEKWLANEGKKFIDDFHNLEARMLQIGVFILPFGNFTMPSGVTDEENTSWMFGLQSKAVADENTSSSILIRKSLKFYAKRFASLAEQYGKIEKNPEGVQPSPGSLKENK